jgi:hypothetical protein
MFLTPVTSIEHCKSVCVKDWSIYEIEYKGELERHIVGFDFTDMWATRVSTAIKKFDMEKMEAVTRSGRHYTLCGEPRETLMAPYPVWLDWCHYCGVEDSVNVTDEYKRH